MNDQTGELIDTGCAGTKLCDCIIHTILRAPDGTPLAYGRATYTVPRHLFKQVAARVWWLPIPRAQPAGEVHRSLPHPLVGTPRRNRLCELGTALLEDITTSCTGWTCDSNGSTDGT